MLITNWNVTVCPSVTISLFYRCTDFNEIWYGDFYFLKKDISCYRFNRFTRGRNLRKNLVNYNNNLTHLTHGDLF